MSDAKAQKADRPDAEMLKNLDLLLNYDVVSSEDKDDAQLLEDLDDTLDSLSDQAADKGDRP
jgi:hypothetical protein